MRTTLMALAVLLAIALLPSSASAATCADYSTQADAQRAADTRDADGDGIYCESLPCPCSSGGGGSTAPPPPPPPPPPATSKPSCSRPTAVQRLLFSAAKYPNIKAHTEAAIAKGWPRILVLNRPHADERRDRLLEGERAPTASGRGPRRISARGRARSRQRQPEGARARDQPDRLDGRRDVRRRTARTNPTAHHWARSCGASATARASGTSSVESHAARPAR